MKSTNSFLFKRKYKLPINPNKIKIINSIHILGNTFTVVSFDFKLAVTTKIGINFKIKLFSML